MSVVRVFRPKRPHKLRESSAHLINLIEKASASVQLDQAIEDIKTFANTTSFLANKLDTRLKGGDVKAKKQVKSRMGKAIAAVPKPSASKPPTPAPQQSTNGMPQTTSTATSQADYDKLKPQGTQGTVGGL